MAGKNQDRTQSKYKEWTLLSQQLVQSQALSVDMLQETLQSLQSIEAGCNFKDHVARATWNERVRTTLRLFEDMLMANCNGWSMMADKRMSDKEVADECNQMISDLTDILREMVRSRPVSISAEAKEVEHHQVSAASGAGIEIKFSASAVYLEAASDDLYNVNRHPIEGVLFRIDEPSEAAPAVGPGCPLYIPRIVAEKLVDKVSGLPFDAHDNLSQHANRDITGVMLSAAIKDNDFVVKGFLWPWNKEDKVQAISAAKDKLGMSMNASAVGHRTTINGREVFQIDDLILLGANILYSDKATYQKTRMIAAQGAVAEDALAEDTADSVDEELDRIAAIQASLTSKQESEDLVEDQGVSESAGDDEYDDEVDPDPDEDDMPTVDESNGDEGDLEDDEVVDTTGDLADRDLDSDQAEAEPLVAAEALLTDNENGDISMTIDADRLREQLDAIAASINSLAGLTTAFERQQEQIDKIQAQVADLKQKDDAEVAAVQAAASAESRKKEAEELAQTIQASVVEQLAKMINPSGQPPRKTIPLSASAVATPAANGSAEKQEILLQLAAEQGRLKALEESIHSSPVDVLSAQEKIFELKMRLEQAA